MRGKLARDFASKLKRAREIVCKRVMKRVIRQRFRNLVNLMVQKLKSTVSKLQRVWRRLKIYKKLILEVNKRVAFKAQERYRKEMERQ